MGSIVSRRNLFKGAAASAVALSIARPASAEPVTHLVRITGFAFVPDHIVVQVGDKISWINDDLAPHTATADEFGWDTGELGQNQSKEIAVRKGMESRYFCFFHPHMTGSLTMI